MTAKCISPGRKIRRTIAMPTITATPTAMSEPHETRSHARLDSTSRETQPAKNDPHAIAIQG